MGEDKPEYAMAKKHSDYIRDLLERELESKIILYEEAFIHGYKHGKNDTKH